MTRSGWTLAAAALAAALQIGLLTWVIQSRAAILRDGTEVLLKVEPVDPRDLLRGDYVRLGYNISDVPMSLFDSSDGQVERGDRLLVRLSRGPDGVWQAKGARLAGSPAPVLADGEIEIAGEVVYGASSSTDSIRVDYGVERFYLPEGEGRDIERDLSTRSFFMKVAVGASGAAQIKAFFDGERQLYEEPHY